MTLPRLVICTYRLQCPFLPNKAWQKMIDSMFQARAHRVERHFRSINDRMVAIETSRQRTTPLERGTVRVICECPLVQCADEIDIEADLYDQLKLRAGQLVVRPGHIVHEDEVIEETSEYWIIRTEGALDAPALTAVEDPDLAPDVLVAMLRGAIEERERVRACRAEAEAQFAALERRSEQARQAAQTYGRAVNRYRSLMRHRMANPLASICGMAETLIHVTDLSEDRRRSLLDSIILEARRLTRLSIDASPINEVERVLDPWPGIDVPVVPEDAEHDHA
jgi:signal transduction histidine kinase